MIRWILIILLTIVLILALVFVFRRFSSDSDEGTVTDVPGEVATDGEGSDQVPIVVGDSFATSEGQPVTGNVLSNDTDPQNEGMTVDTVPTNGPTNGILELAGDGSFTYTPNAGYVGADSFSYQVCDASNNCAVGTAQITVNSSTDAGTADSGEGTGDAQPADDSSADSGDTGSDTGDVTDDSSTAEQPTDSGAADGGEANMDDTSTDSQPSDSSEGDASADTSTTDDAASGTSGQPDDGATTHDVKQGEWLLQIARCYGTAPETIVSDNKIPYPGWLMVDESLTISGTGSVSEPFFEPCVMFHTVEQGDTLYSLAQTYQVELDMLIKANFGCYGYGYYYQPPVVTPYDGDENENPDGWYMHSRYAYGPGYGAHSPFIYTGCYAPYYNPVIYVGQELVIPVNLDNADMRPAPASTQ